VLETEQHAIEHVTGFIGRNRIGSFAQTVAQIFLPNRDDFRAFKFRERRKLVLWQTENLKEALAATDRRGIFSIDIDLNLARWQFADDVKNTPRRQGRRSCFVHVRFASAAHANVQVGGCQIEFGLVSLQQNVRKNGQRSASAHYVLNLLQGFEQFFL